MINILVVFDNNDCLITRMNCDLKDAKQYYIGNYFDGKIAKNVIDTNDNFKIELPNMPTYEYKFNKLNYNAFNGVCGLIELDNITLDNKTYIEPAWFYNSEREVLQ
jgi:hypothetical protein